MSADDRTETGTIEDGFGSEWGTCHERCSLEVVRLGKVQCHGLYVPADTEDGTYQDAVDEDGFPIFTACPWGNTPHLETPASGSSSGGDA